MSDAGTRPDDDDRALTQEDVHRAVARLGGLFGEPQYADAEEEYAAIARHFDDACEELRGRGRELVVGYGELSDAFLHHPAGELLNRALGETPYLRRLDARKTLLHLGRQWVRDAGSEEVVVGLAVLRRMLLDQPDAAVHAAEIFSGLVVDLLERGRSEHDVEVLGEGLRLAREAAALALATSPLLAVTQYQRGECAHALYRLTWDTGHLTEALLALRTAVEASARRAAGPTPDETPGFRFGAGAEDPRYTTGRLRAEPLALLARCTLDSYALTGGEDDRREAVALLREAVDLTPPGDPGLPHRHVLLARALTADPAGPGPALLEEAVRQAAAGRDADGGAEWGRLMELRYRHSGDVRLLHRAVDALEPGEGVARDARLAQVLTALYEQVRDSTLLERAIALHRSVLAATPDADRSRPGRLAACAEALVLHAERRSDPAALREAVRCYRAALRRPPAPHREAAALRVGLALALHRLGAAVADAAGARAEAVLLGRAVAADFPVGHPDRTAVLASLAPVLASGLTSRARSSGAELERGVEVARELVDRLPEADPSRPLRLMELGVALGERFARRGDEADRRDACAAFARAARSPVLPPVTRCLAAREGAALQAGAGNWTGAAEAYRLAVDLLPGVAVRDLRRDDQEFHLTSFARLASDAAAAVLRGGGSAEEAVDVLERGRGILLSQAMESDEGAVRADTGRPASPVVVVNSSAYGCTALVVLPDGVARIPLPDVTAQEITDRSEAFTLAVELAGGGHHLPEHRVAADRFVTRTLGWLWDVIAEPVLAEVRADRLWWLPTGALSFLPLHAAGHHHDGSGRTVLDRTVSSYTPTLRMLALSRARARRVALPAEPLVVALPETPGAAPLPGVTSETGELLRLRPGARVLHGSAAGRDATLAALRSGGWTHFACHAVSDAIEPSASRLLLADGALSVLDIVRLRIENAQLAYLSACSTARGGAHLADEAIHIGSAFQLAGYPHVVATLWPIADQAAAAVAGTVYRSLADGPAAAVHTATRQLRDACRGRSPLLWASHIHLGA
ncbi:CHAT domain-containing protein [Streptomyces sp. enrichment culture]|uniref:CHAT domain-containing protein n=1 Tax=Streptomyces sp. enrichment culture TaxID=1795815 RepID=UPI003F556084